MTDLQPAFAYLRVSTKKQLLNEISVEQQEILIREAAERQGFQIVQVFIDGKSGRNSKDRASFQQMLALAARAKGHVKAVFVWKFDRFARNTKDALIAAEELDQSGLDFISATQPIPPGPSGKLMRTILMAVAENESDNNALQVETVMRANAREGFWNGSRPPLGYRIIIAERRGKKDKKKLDCHPDEARLVELIFRTYRHGEHGSGPMGLKALAIWLNDKGLRHRGQRFMPSLLHDILTRETYVGRHYYNVKDSRSGKKRPREEWIEVPTPRIISDEDFHLVQRQLTARNPNMSAARSHTSPVLLSGISHCGGTTCNGTMMLSTGGTDADHRYYACSERRVKGSRDCDGTNVRMDVADEAVISALEKRLFNKERLKVLLADILEQSAEADTKRRKNLALFRAEVTDIDKATRSLMLAIEAGNIDPSDPTLKERFAVHKARRATLQEQIKRLEQQLGSKQIRLSDQKLEHLAALMRRRLRDPADPTMRKKYVRAFVGRVTLDKKRIVIEGPTSALASAAFNCEQMDTNALRTSVLEWRARNDSNVRPSDS